MNECDGAPHGPTGDLGDFAPKGEPKNLNHQHRASLDDGDRAQPSSQNGEAVPGTARGALKEFGGISGAIKTGSIDAETSIDIPRESEHDAANLKV